MHFYEYTNRLFSKLLFSFKSTVRVFVLFNFMLVSVSALGQEIEVIQPLNIGVVAITDNDSIGSIEIDAEAVTRVRGGVRLISQGQPALVQARGYEANRRLFISIQPNQFRTATEEVSPEQFTVVSYQVAEFVVTDENGIANFNIGGTFATSGNGSLNFRDTEYPARYTITVNY
ncbi:DUF4402 domain-containing protein [Glaciecola sp. MH2013]|uniref:DUF4402 domain-containing protein n=1 Tax=Glaciecola sp. MH2013 TaxID=2785524 RepID=UPI0018A0EE70|nr:DUF4402 domain-containing protein [Glaciecola sp. MH2013]MBF7072413.1 DUF4402 domain-containing protein [Glaciecola sp. MH2013]